MIAPAVRAAGCNYNKSAAETLLCGQSCKSVYPTLQAFRFKAFALGAPAYVHCFTFAVQHPGYGNHLAGNRWHFYLDSRGLSSQVIWQPHGYGGCCVSIAILARKASRKSMASCKFGLQICPAERAILFCIYEKGAALLLWHRSHARLFTQRPRCLQGIARQAME